MKSIIIILLVVLTFPLEAQSVYGFSLLSPSSSLENWQNRVLFLLNKYQETLDPVYLKDLLPWILKAHENLDDVQFVQFYRIWEQVLRGKEDIRELYLWFRENTAFRYIEIGDNWNLAVKTETGDGSWWKYQKPEHRLEMKLNRNTHIQWMISAGQAILQGRYDFFTKSVYQHMVEAMHPEKEMPKNVLEEVNPNVNPNVLEFSLSFLTRLPERYRRILVLGLVLHDYGRIFKDRFLMDPEDKRPYANQHRVSGTHLVHDFCRKLGINPLEMEWLKLLVLHHDAFWNLYCIEKGYGNNFTTPELVLKDIHETKMRISSYFPKYEEENFKEMALKMLAIVNIADVFASGDRYLSDDYVEFVIRFIQIQIESPLMLHSFFSKSA